MIWLERFYRDRENMFELRAFKKDMEGTDYKVQLEGGHHENAMAGPDFSSVYTGQLVARHLLFYHEQPLRRLSQVDETEAIVPCHLRG